jgi:hypothetical protein
MAYSETYKGFVLCESKRHGKCVKGRKKTTSIQIRDVRNVFDGYFLKKQISYPVGNIEKRDESIEKAKDFVDAIIDKEIEGLGDFYCGNLQSGIEQCNEQCAGCADNT